MLLQLVLLFCIVIYALYHVANYAHSKDTKFGKSAAARIFIITGEILYLLPICYVPIDVELKTRGEGAFDVSLWIWTVLTASQMTYIWLVCPILFAFYETDDNNSCCRRLWDAFRFQLPLLITLVILIVPTFFFLNEVQIPEDKAKLCGLEPNAEIDGKSYFVAKNGIT